MAKIVRIIQKLRQASPYLREIFYVLGGGLIILSIIEIIKPRLVLAYVNLSAWLLLWLACGLLILIFNHPPAKSE